MDLRNGDGYESAVSVLAAISSCLSEGPEDLQTFLGRIGTRVAPMVGAHGCCFWRLNESSELVLLSDSRGVETGRHHRLRVRVDPLGAGVLDQVVFRDDFDVECGPSDGGGRYAALLRTLEVEDAIWASWRAGDQVFGAIGAYDSRHGFSTRDLQVLRIAAGTCGIAYRYRLAEDGLQHAMELTTRLADSRRVLLHRHLLELERERKSIGRDIHGDALQLVTAVELRLQRLRGAVEGKERGMVEEVAALVAQVDRSLRALLFGLRPPALDLHGGLKAAIREYLDRVQARSEIDVKLTMALPDDIPVDAGQLVFRILQGAVTNAEKHARASRLDVAFDLSEGGALVRVSDDGCGFDLGAPPRPGHVGLASMRERAQLAGGWCRIESRPDAGTSVAFWIPFSLRLEP